MSEYDDMVSDLCHYRNNSVDTALEVFTWINMIQISVIVVAHYLPMLISHNQKFAH
jgi:hypothetical protein